MLQKRALGPLLFLALSITVTATTDADADQWTLTGTTFNQSSWESQPYVANGYIGQRLPAAGMGYYQITPINASADDGTSGWPLFDPRFTASMVAGFYDQQPTTSGTNFAQTGGEQPISTLPTWSSLYLSLTSNSNSTTYTYTPTTSPSQISAYTQSLSLQNGVVVTALTWTPVPGEAAVKVRYTVFAHRTRPNLGVVRLDVEGVESLDGVAVTDVLDGAGAWRTTPIAAGVLPNASSTIYTAVQPNGITNVTAYQVSQLTFPSLSSSSASASAVNASTQGCFAGVSTNASTASQCYTFPSSSSTSSKNKTLTAIKYIGIASSDAFSGTELSTARAAVDAAEAAGYEKLLAEHTEAWSALWDDADIVIPSPSSSTSQSTLRELQLITRASIFHLLSNVREGKEGHGLGDNSIAPAGLTSDSYAGQVFWDADTWMAPALGVLFPGYAESITNFRYRQLGAAMENSMQYNRSGALYPWTAGRFGNCTGVGPCYDYEYHLENDISLAQYQYYASTQNKTWLEEKGWPVVQAVAQFWASQVVWNASTGAYDTYNETDPDEYANFRNNAAYTNAGISVILQNAIELAGILGITPPSNWTQIADKITVLSDNASGITLEYDGFNGSTAVKQADVVLLTYPLEYHESTTEALQDLDFYALATSPSGPGMTYSIFSIDVSAVSPIGCASYTYLLAASQPYTRAPFYQFSEQTTDAYETNGGTNPAYTFLTAHGGFLQSFTHGFTGYRSRLNAFYLDPTLPDQLTNYTVKGMKWLDSSFDVTLTTESTTIVRRNGTTTTAPVEISSNNAKGGNYTLKVGESLVVPTRHTNGTLVAGNLAQCKSVLAADTSFVTPNTIIVPGQYALSAIDGSNATAWQPLVNTSSSMTIDLESTQTITKLHLNWGANPATSFQVSVGNSTDSMTQIAAANVTISAPYNATAVEQVTIKVGNLTDVQLPQAIQARYLNVTLSGSYLADGRGGTLAEFAVL